MRALSSSEGGPTPPLLRRVKPHINPLCALAYAAGVAWLLTLCWPAFNLQTYFSENALLPGLVDDDFSSDKEAVAAHARLLDAWKQGGDAAARDWLARSLAESGLETYTQNFSVGADALHATARGGVNVYAMVRAGRGSGAEAVVLAVPLRRSSSVAIAIATAIAAFCREQVYWAKDLVFVFADHDLIGMQAWLASYHQTSIAALSFDSLEARAGVIQAAVAFQTAGVARSYSHAHVGVTMFNGQLPNLDLVNLAIKMVEKESLTPTVFYQQSPSRRELYSERGYLQLARTAAHGLLAQAIEHPLGLHSVFAGYGIEAVTISPYSVKQGKSDYVKIGRVLEGVLRSLNNLLERLHQSYFFYFLLSTHRFVSIGVYMPALGLILLAPALKAVAIWTDLNEIAAANGKSGEHVESLLSVAPVFLLAHACGAATYAAVARASAAGHNGDFILSLLLASVVAPLPVFYVLGRKSAPRQLTRCCAALLLVTVLGVAAVFNFGLGLLVAIAYTPACTAARPVASWWRRSIGIVSILLVHPLTLLSLCCVAYTWPSAADASLLSDAVQLAKGAILTTISNGALCDSWLFWFCAVALYPLWLLFWFVTTHRASSY